MRPDDTSDNGPGLTTVVDSHPRFWCECVLWLLCAARHFNGPRRVYFVGDPPPALAALVARLGGEARLRTAPLLAEAPHCNKLLPFLDPDGFDDQIVTDTDLFLVRDIAPLFRPDRVRLAPNNHGNPPLPVFVRLFEAAGITEELEPGLGLFAGQRGRETYAGNVSAGVVMIPRALREFAAAWLARAEWLTAQRGLLGPFFVHIDQISFALAAHEAELPFQPLPPQANAILQLLPQIQTPYALHLTSGHIPRHPDWFDADGRLRGDRINPALAPVLEAFNTTAQEAMQEIAAIPELRAFRPNFLNPAYRR